jgi:hypothetical protein
MIFCNNYKLSRWLSVLWKIQLLISSKIKELKMMIKTKKITSNKYLWKIKSL